jgi:heat shock protein HslJ
MKKTYVTLMAALVALAVALAACTPTGGEPESITAPTEQPAAEATADGATDLENTDEMSENGLTGVRWGLVSYQNAAGETVDALPDHEATAEFGADGRMGGQGSCNNYFASYTVDGNNLTISQAGSTMMACEPAEVMQQEADFLAALQSAATFTRDGDTLQIANADGETVLTFEAIQPASLVGTNWTATMVNNNLEAVSSLMAETAITATFTEDGQLNGSAGCNNYMTSYTLDGANITIQPPATTRKMCPEPAGVMEQEAAFVTMLPQAATYTISGDSLELRTADGALIVSFIAE